MKQKNDNLTFNEHFGVPDGADHLDITLESDLEAFICPFLIVNDKKGIISSQVNYRSGKFLEELNTNYVKTNDRKKGIPFLSHLGEANEYNLGYSKTNKGKGIAVEKAETIFSALRNNRFAKQGVSITNEAHNVLLLVKGIGQDNMSDVLANICRDIFADFTLKQCKKYNIPTSEVKIKFFNSITKKWDYKKVQLPKYLGKHKILLPKNIISGSRDYSTLYNWFISRNYISYEILNSKEDKSINDKYCSKLKDGTKKAIIKRIYKDYHKPKGDLIDFVLKYQGSLLEFQIYAKEHYPSLNLENLDNVA